ncbi:pyruvate, water dikinase regulatory protein [Futiania mangrovi]|uniref:Putative pyruvate, phosphate dikinase regulatory protein n=1 Tax=Futiania mangrovi TaxID=2959716 RepID=A0A9J6PF88_9PROT|nr:pyruvate, water dikinase regulatory protein [Futiania mangrovii]MCP1336496.1 kinase/pyrophosphorylase [Futiania mangrovii]
MSARRKTVTYFHLHLVSDSTGETINVLAKAAVAQFERVQPIEHSYALVRTPRQLEKVFAGIADAPGIVLFTLVNEDLRHALVRRCAELGMPCLSVLDGVLAVFEAYLGTKTTHRPGGQHQLDSGYFARIDALNYTMAHDDGQNVHELDQADVVLLGVSRTSKTPTCIYLANRGVKAANVPVVPGIPLPPIVENLRRPLVVGLLASPERLVQIRRNRLLSLSETEETDYVNPSMVRDETSAARRLYEKLGIPVIDVSRRSIEETAAAIFTLYQQRKANGG